MVGESGREGGFLFDILMICHVLRFFIIIYSSRLFPGLFVHVTKLMRSVHVWIDFGDGAN